MATHRILDQTVYIDGRWQTSTINVSELPMVSINSLKICTYNIWFGNERQQLRMQHLLKIVSKHNCDIFCFQEVTQQLLTYILSSPFIQKYYLSGITNNDIGSYGNVIFSRWPLSNVYINRYSNTGMERKLVCVDIIINNQLFRFGTVHLESLEAAAKKRVVQLKETMQFMVNKKHETMIRPKHLMLMGDFNECATKNKEALPMTDKQFIDAWSVYYGGDGKYEQKNPGWTMPKTDVFPPWRPDRLYYAFNYDYTELDDGEEEKKEEVDGGDVVNENKDEWMLKGIKRVGMDKIPSKDGNAGWSTVFTPSDHYGLIAQFVCGDDVDVDELCKEGESGDIMQATNGNRCGCVLL